MNKEQYIEKFFDLSKELIVITGGAGKLAGKYSGLLSSFGAKVILLDIKPFDKLDFELGNNVSYITCDITSKSEVEKVFLDIKKRFGPVSVLINNAAAGQTTFVEGNLIEFENFPLEVWQSNLNVNLTGSFLCSQAAGKHMLELGRGNILNIGSTYGVVACDQRIYGDSGLNSNVAYATTKSGLLNFTRYLASYWQGKNIRVNCLVPGGVFNNQPNDFYENYIYRTMLKRMATWEDLGAAILYLVSDSSAWVTGSIQTVDGGFTAW